MVACTPSTAYVPTLQGVRTQLFGRVRAAVAKRLLHGRPSFGAAFLAMQHFADDVGRLPLYSIRLDHTYHLEEFVELQVKQCGWTHAAVMTVVGMQQRLQGACESLRRRPCAHSSFRLDCLQPSMKRSRCNDHHRSTSSAGAHLTVIFRVWSQVAWIRHRRCWRSCVQQHADECRAVVRCTADFEDRSSVETPVFGKAARPMSLIKAEKAVRAR